ncbi:hypothetical protein B0H15DRAFT_811831 [Mycena belliarum]|uniref:Uncharacterized protein n=1 Tax=Mycena belliarum TaxID=1033014 RepID=A0AAD6UJE1_9AGAR|nr:hypothetical protein B0H15DRAFT_811831 [Mycena belliae]
MASSASAVVPGPLSSASGPLSSASLSSSEPAPPPSSSTLPPSSSTAPTSSAPVSPSESVPVSSVSSPAVTSSAATTSAAQSTAAPPPTSTTLTTPSTTVAQTTLTSTSNGQTFTTVLQVTSTIAAGSTVVASPKTTRTTSHTGAIVGGVIGGLAFLLAIGAGFLWYRRRSRYKDEFDGNFDPARVTSTRPVSTGPEMIANTGGTLPRMNIDDDDDDYGVGHGIPHSTRGGGIINPFMYAPTAAPSSRSQSPPMSMSQYSQDGYAPTLSSAGGYYAAMPRETQAVGGHYPPSAPSNGSASSYNPRSAKEREAQRAGFAIANPSHDNEPRAMSGAYDEQYQMYLRSGPQNARNSPRGESDRPPLSPTASSSAASHRASGVLVHKDGGRVDAVQEEQADEIPPTYDSLPKIERK